MIDFFPKPKRPYVIVAPAYDETSAGVRALHHLCHALNLAGYPAGIALMEGKPGPHAFHPGLVTPLPAWVDDNSIVVYPDLLGDLNPLNAKNVVRFLLYYAGRLGAQSKNFAPTDAIWAWSRRIAQDIGTDNVMTVPVVNTKVFHPPEEGAPRKGALVYARKYQSVFGGKLLPVSDGALELTGEGRTTEQVADMLRKAEVLFVYENSTIIREATVCGCPVVCVWNEHFTEVLDDAEFQMGGVVDDIADLDKARATLRAQGTIHLAAFHRFEQALRQFITQTQGMNP